MYLICIECTIIIAALERSKPKNICETCLKIVFPTYQKIQYIALLDPCLPCNERECVCIHDVSFMHTCNCE